MNCFKIIAASLLLVFFIAGCNADHNRRESYAPSSTNETGISTDSTSIADAPINSPDRKIIRTADLRCRVTDVYQTTSGLEGLVNNLGGQVAESRLDNTIDDTRKLQYSTDSLQLVQSYTTTAHLTLKVPFQKLDTLLLAIAGQSAFMNERSLRLEDATLKYLGNQLKNDAGDGSANRKASKASDLVIVGDYNDQRIDRRIENMDITQQVRYATLTLDLYQPQRIDRQIVADTDKMMQPGFGQRTLTALAAGWQLVQELLLVLIRIWPLMLAGLLVFILIRKKAFRFAKR